MLAKDIFESLGYTQARIDEEEYNEYYILYTKGDIKIEFYKEFESYNIWRGSTMNNVYIDKFLHKAIHQQCIELGWLDE